MNNEYDSFSYFFAGDGCIFVWRLPHEMTATMQNRLAQLESASPAKSRAYIAMEPTPLPSTAAAPATTAAQMPPPTKPTPSRPALQTEETFSSSIPDAAPPMTPADNDYRYKLTLFADARQFDHREESSPFDEIIFGFWQKISSNGGCIYAHTRGKSLLELLATTFLPD